jgi:hypothetical protein
MTEPNSQRCVICGRLFIKRPEPVCSRDCLAKLTSSSSTLSASNANPTCGQ